MKVEKVELNQDELEEISGGYKTIDKMFYELRYVFSDSEVELIKKHLNITVVPYRQYKSSELRGLGIGGDTDQSVKDALTRIGLRELKMN